MAAIVQAVDLTKQVLSGDQPLTILHEVEFHGRSRRQPRDPRCVRLRQDPRCSACWPGWTSPSSGTVYLDGTDIFSFDEDSRARLRGRLAGFVFQSFQLLPALTALENVMLPLELHGAADARERATKRCGRSGLAQRAHHLPKHLSGGEQQRVAIARAFVVQPKILFADEPTGNLDAATGSQIIELMLELNRAQGTTLILVTHDEALARRCNRQLHLAAGRVM